MANIKVTPDELRHQAQTYTTQASVLTEALNTLINMNNTIASEWTGDAFTSFQNEFESTHQNNIKNTVSALEDVKARIDQAANNFEEQDANNSSMFN